MSVNKLFIGVSLALVFIATAIAALGLIQELANGTPPNLLIHSLEAWVNETAYRLAIIVLAAAGTYYLVNKK